MDDAAAEDGEPDAGADDRRWTGGEQVPVEDDEVRVQARCARGRGGAPRRRRTRSPRCTPPARPRRQPLAREPAARGLPVRGLAVDGVVEGDERVVGDHRPVRSEGEPRRPRRGSSATPTPGSRAPARCSRPRPRSGWATDPRGTAASTRRRPAIAKRGMSAGSIVSMCSTRCRRSWVPGAAPPPARIAGPRPVRGRRVLEGVQRQPDPTVADRVQLDLPAAPVGLGRRRRRGRPAPRPAGPRSCRPRTAPASTAVFASITPSTKPLRIPASSRSPAAQPEGERPRTRRGGPATRRGVWSGLHDQRARGTGARSSPSSWTRHPERQLVGLQPGVLGGREAHRRAGRRWPGGPRRGRRPRTGRGCGRSTSSCASSLSAPVGSPSASRTMTPLGGSGVVPVDPGQAQRRGVRPARCGRRSSP